MLPSSLKRKKMHFIVVGDGLEKRKLSVHGDRLQLCFPDKDIHSMGGNQDILLLLTIDLLIVQYQL